MNWKLWIGLSGLLWLLPLAASAEDLGAGRISFIQGQAQIQPAGTKEWQLASVNVPVRAGDRFWTPEDARMELQFQNGTILRLDYKSTLDVLNLDQTMMQFHLSMGHLLFRASRKPVKTIQVDLPDSSLVVQDKALFRVDITPDGGEEFGLFQGTMQVATSGTKTHIQTGEMLTLENGSSEVAPLKPEDEWEQWNTDRDQAQKRAAASAPYLPPELNAYADDLNSNGDWVEVPDYGYCWEPRVGIGVGWAPFRFGRWLWIDDDWLWVGDEPWGWAPYHFGSWLWFSDRWCWVPPLRGQAHWGPGNVGWIHTARYVGWVPLAPGEHGVPVNGAYHNLPHAGATTLVERSVFASGRVVPVTPKENILTPGKYQLGSPGIHPTGNLHVGAAAPANKLPSKSIQSLDMQQLRNQHPQLRVIPPQVRQGRSGYGAQGQRAAVHGGYRSSTGAPVWGNRSVQRMWWVSPKSSGRTGNASGQNKVQGIESGGNYRGGGNSGSNVHGGGDGGGGGNVHGGGDGGGGNVHGGRR